MGGHKAHLFNIRGVGLGYEHSYHDIAYYRLYPELRETQFQSIEISVYKHFKEANQEEFYIKVSLYLGFTKTKLYITDSTYIPHILGGYYKYDYRTEIRKYPF